MRGSDLLGHIYRRSASLTTDHGHIIVGPGDDCAVVRESGVDLLLKVDQLVVGRHATAETPADLIARKAIARTVSDIAAMAGSCSVALASAALPKGFNQSRADLLFDALSKWALHFGCPLVGGDIASQPKPEDPLVLTITLLGRPHAARGPVLRSTAKPGDLVCVTGALGGSLDTDSMGRHLTFEPRITEAVFLASTFGDALTAMMDISDGLGIDAGRMARASKVTIEIDADRLPRHGGIDLKRAISDGEDYELLFTVSPDAKLPETCPPGSGDTGTPITVIGRVTDEPGSGVWLLTADGREDIAAAGFDHG